MKRHSHVLSPNPSASTIHLHLNSRTFCPVERGLIERYGEGTSKEARDEAGVGTAAVTRHRGELQEAVGSHREPQGAAGKPRTRAAPPTIPRQTSANSLKDIETEGLCLALISRGLSFDWYYWPAQIRQFRSIGSVLWITSYCYFSRKRGIHACLSDK